MGCSLWMAASKLHHTKIEASGFVGHETRSSFSGAIAKACSAVPIEPVLISCPQSLDLHGPIDVQDRLLLEWDKKST